MILNEECAKIPKEYIKLLCVYLKAHVVFAVCAAVRCVLFILCTAAPRARHMSS